MVNLWDQNKSTVNKNMQSTSLKQVETYLKLRHLLSRRTILLQYGYPFDTIVFNKLLPDEQEFKPSYCASFIVHTKAPIYSVKTMILRYSWGKRISGGRIVVIQICVTLNAQLHISHILLEVAKPQSWLWSGNVCPSFSWEFYKLFNCKKSSFRN